MAKRKLDPFSADDASDEFTPTVKTLKGADVQEEVSEVKPSVQKREKYKEKEVKFEESESKKKVRENKQLLVKEMLKDEVEKPAPRKEKKLKEEKERKEELSETMVELVGFVVGNEEFGIDIQKVQEINRMVEVTHVPRAPSFVEGVINLRGKVIPVISMRKRFGLPEKEKDSSTRIVVVEVKGSIIGFVVDSVSEVLRIPESTIEPPPDIVAGIDAEYIVGVGKLEDRLLILLELGSVLSREKIDQLKVTA